ncbi:alpha/beta fold hydrolase [Thermodesulfobacteriota bacterium]
MTFPIVLAHGVCRFDQIWRDLLDMDNSDDEKKDQWHYFKGVRTMLMKKGYHVFHSNVSWAAGVEKRADDLLENLQNILEETKKDKLNIIAHSMGGLDARHMMFNDRKKGKIHERIASLTTISTPHWGSSFADWGVKNLSRFLPIAEKLGLELEAFKDLTVEACTRFNKEPEVRDFEHECESNVVFQTYAGKQDFKAVFDVLKLSFYIIEKEEGENDGLVSVKSAKWKDRFFKGYFEQADHLNELGWWDIAQIWSKENDSDLLSRIHKIYAEIAEGLP